jgi:hypothetical protein
MENASFVGTRLNPTKFTINPKSYMSLLLYITIKVISNQHFLLQKKTPRTLIVYCGLVHERRWRKVESKQMLHFPHQLTDFSIRKDAILYEP